MIRVILCLAAAILIIGCDEKPGAPTRATAPVDSKLAQIRDAISKTGPDGKAMIEKAQGMKPEVNGLAAAKTLGEIVDDFSKTKETYNIIPIGWEASQKKTGNWKIVFHYQDYQKRYLAAEWEYNPGTNKLYPFDFENSPQFWTGAADKDKAKK